MSVSLLTIPHTGTHWMMRVLARMGVQVRHEHFFVGPPRWATLHGSIVTLRDPLLARISAINRNEPYGVEVWGTLKDLHPDTFFFPIEHPDWDGLEGYTKRSRPEVVPPPLNKTDDLSGLRRAYADGRGWVPAALFEDAMWLHENVSDFFAEHGYDLPWMKK